jgi:CelD/BcsL family acetyltransferase involved in cellulose biosynthesis
VARSATEVCQLQAAWEALVSPELTLFQSFRWNRLAAALFADREPPYFIFAENDSGAAILPAVIDTESKTVSLAGEKLFDYRDYLSQGDTSTLLAATRELAQLNLPLAITAICRGDAPLWRALPKTFFSRAPHLISGAVTPEEFAGSHARAFSRLRKLQRMGLRIGWYSGESPVIRQVYELRGKQAEPGELFHDARRVEFMIAICREEGSRCEVFTLEHGGTLAAALVTFRDEQVRRFYTTYYDHRWARYSPGISLLFEVVRRSLEQGLSFDLMTGEQSYKLRIARTSRDLYCVKASPADLQQAGMRARDQAA